MTTYRSKIGPELVIPLGLSLGTVFILLLLFEPGWTGSLILLPIIIFITYMFANTYYVVDETVLRIKCGFLYHKQIDILSIQKIKESNNPLSAPATSLDRLELIYGKRNYELISPKDKQAFINHIKSINPNAEVIWNKQKKTKSTGSA
jgi:hypothetical protein